MFYQANKNIICHLRFCNTLSHITNIFLKQIFLTTRNLNFWDCLSHVYSTDQYISRLCRCLRFTLTTDIPGKVHPLPPVFCRFTGSLANLLLSLKREMNCVLIIDAFISAMMANDAWRVENTDGVDLTRVK